MVLPFAYALFAILFEFPLTAAGVAGAAVGVPVIIHLLNRRRFKIVEWAAMRFLIQAQKKNSRRIRLEQLILLLIRCLIVLLVAASMMAVTGWAEKLWRAINPQGGRGLVQGGTRTHKIIVIDGSFSMGARPPQSDKTIFDRAKQKALELVSGSGGDGYSVVLMASPPKRIVPRPSDDAKKVAGEIRAMKMTHGNADLAGTFNTIASLLRESPGKFNSREVYFVTDMQKAGWQSPRPGDLTSALTAFRETGTKVIFVDVGEENLSNLAITSLELGEPFATTGAETRIIGNLYNHGETRDGVKVRLFIARAAAEANDKPAALAEISEAAVDARRGQHTAVSFVYRFPEPGDYLVQLQVSAQGDNLTLDDTRSAVVRVRNTVPVLIVNGKQAPEAFDRASEYVRVALDPTREGERGLPARPRVMTQSQFAEATELNDFDGIFLCDLDNIGANETKRLEAHVRRGGALIVCTGGKTDVNNINDALYRNGEGLLPAKLLGLQRTTDKWYYQLQMAEGADREEPLLLFQNDGARQLLGMPHFSAFWKSEPAKAIKGTAPRKVLSFGVPAVIRGAQPIGPAPPGGPAIWEWRPPMPSARHGDDKDGPPVSLSTRGRVILITTTVNAEWTNWPASPIFLPMMHELLYYGAAARLRERALLVGEPINLYLSAAGEMNGSVEVPHDPNEPPAPEPDKRHVTTQILADGTVLRFGETDLSGVYRITFGASPREYFFAVNVPSSSDDQVYSESNLARTTKAELETAYPEWGDLQVVSDVTLVDHTVKNSVTGEEIVYQPQGGPIARVLLLIVLGLLVFEVLLAWLFGHYSVTATKLPGEQIVRNPTWQKIAWLMPYVFFGLLGIIALILLHNAVTGDFLSFLPNKMRAAMESMVGVPPPAVGEGTHWRLEFGHYFVSEKADPWLIALFAVVATGLIGVVYFFEGDDVSRWTRVLFLCLRIAILFMMLAVFLPQLKVHFERQGWPDVVILIDDSASMSSYDVYREDDVRAAADELAKLAELTEDERTALEKVASTKANVTKASRLRLAQALLMQNGDEKLRAMMEKRQVRLHVYRCASRAERKAEVTQPDEIEKASKAIGAMKAELAHDSSQLGTSIRQVLNDFRGASLAAVVTFTDGVTTEGEDIAGVSKYALQMGVPLYFVGVGDSHEQRDLYLHDLQAEDTVFVKDRIIFEIKVTAQGYNSLTVPVKLYEKGKDRPLYETKADVDTASGTVKVRLVHRPEEPGEKTYVIKVPIQADEVDRENNVAEKMVYVHEGKQIKVLYVEGYRRYEYSYVKTLLEREANFKGNKSIKLRVFLQDGDPDLFRSDPTIIKAMPEPIRDAETHTTDEDLWSYDLIILGDVDPEDRIQNHLKNVAEFVRERGGGLLMVAGERYSPRAYKNTAIKDILPVDLTGERVAEGDGDEGIVDSYRMELTPVGKMHPIFRFAPDEKDNDEVWSKLKEFFWFADGYVPKRAAEVLATHPQIKAAGRSGGKHPLVIQQFSGAGRCMLFAFNETWRWNWREDQAHFNQFWLQVVRYLSRSKIGRVELRLDRQTPYRRGEPIKVTVRFPDDEKPPPKDTAVKVLMERKSPGSAPETRTLKLALLEGSRATFDTTVTQTPEGVYNFKLIEPSVKPQPEASCKVLAPPGELERLRMNRGEMEAAAEKTQGKFYTLATAKNLPEELPQGPRVNVSASGPPYLVWNSFVLFLLFLATIGTEWLLRKLKNLL